MNILFHLIRKDNVAYITEDSTLRQAMEKMEFHRYTAVPVIDNNGMYIGVLREGDILWYIKNLDNFNLAISEKVSIKNIPRTKDHEATRVTTNMDDLIELAIEQNFIPVVDDSKNFIGIVTRKSIITYLVDKNKEKK